jgi:putative membrane protein
MRRAFACFALILGVASFTPFVVAQGGAAPARQMPLTEPSQQDIRFAKEAAMINMAEVKLGGLAVDRGSSAFVKKFGQMMQHDHTAAQNELKQLAADNKITLPTKLDAKHQAVYNKLARLKGAAFDRAYKAEMMKGHKEALNKFRLEAKNGQDAEIKAYAARNAPIVQTHLQILQTGKFPAGH